MLALVFGVGPGLYFEVVIRLGVCGGQSVGIRVGSTLCVGLHLR